MIHNFKASSLLVLCFLSLLFASCAQRYGNIPRVHVKAKHKTFRSNGHYVSPSKTNPQRAAVENRVVTAFQYDEAQKASTEVLLPKGNIIQKRIHNTVRTKETIDSLNQDDSLGRHEIDKSLIKGSTSLLVVATGLNAAILIAPSYSFLFIGLLIGLGLLVIGYFIAKFVENSRNNKVFPVRVRSKAAKDRSQLKKAFNISMIISGSSFALALFTAATGSFALPFFFFILGMVTLYVGLLVGLIYVIAGA